MYKEYVSEKETSEHVTTLVENTLAEAGVMSG